MKRLSELWGKLAKALGLQTVLLKRANSRYKAQRKKAYKANVQKEAALKAADRLRKQGHPAKAVRKDKKAARLGVRVDKCHNRAIFWRGRVKTLVRQIHGITQDQKTVKAEIVEWQRKHGATVKGNKAHGGTPEQRWRAVCLEAVSNCSGGHRRNFYNQGGSWDCKHEIKPGPSYSERSDCSQFVTGMCWSADLPDPNGESWNGGYTGTLAQAHGKWKKVSEHAMRNKGWGYIVYGGGVGHHTEAYIGGERTVGHGSAPVDFGVINLFGDGDYSCFILD